MCVWNKYTRNEAMISDFCLSSTYRPCGILEAMDKHSGMGMKMPEMQELHEEPAGVELKELTKANFAEYEPWIKSLQANALNVREGKSFMERKEDVTDLKNKYLSSSKQGELYVIEKGDDVLGFVALKKTFSPARVAHVEQIRLISRDGQGGNLTMALKGIASTLRQEGIHHAVIHVDKDAKTKLGKITAGGRNDQFKGFYSIEQEGDEDEKKDAGTSAASADEPYADAA